MRWFIAINNEDEESFGESVHLNRDCLIGDGASGCIHVDRVKWHVDSICPLDLHPSDASNLNHYDSRDGRSILIHLTPH